MKGGKPPAFSAQDIVEFIFFPVVNEGCRVVAEGIVDKPADLDVATVLAMGFPPYRSVSSSPLPTPTPGPFVSLRAFRWRLLPRRAAVRLRVRSLFCACWWPWYLGRA